MEKIIWILQCVLAAIFFLSGTVVYLFRNKLKSRLSWLSEYSPSMVLFICVSKILGAMGLFLPTYVKLFPILTPLAALGLAIVMILATRYHLRKGEFKDLPATLLFSALLFFVVYGTV